MRMKSFKRICAFVLPVLICAACLFSCKGNTDESAQSAAPPESDFSAAPSEQEQSAVSEVSPAPSEPEISEPEVSVPEVSEPGVSEPDVSEEKNYVEPTEEELNRLMREAYDSYILYAPINDRRIACDRDAPTELEVGHYFDGGIMTGTYYPVTDERFDTKAKLTEYLVKLFAEPLAGTIVYNLFGGVNEEIPPMYFEKDERLYVSGYTDMYSDPYECLPDFDAVNWEQPEFRIRTIPEMTVKCPALGSSALGVSRGHFINFVFNNNGEWVLALYSHVGNKDELVFWNPVDRSEVEKLAVITPDVSDEELKKLVTDAFSRYDDARNILNISLDYDPDTIIEGFGGSADATGTLCRITDERFNTPEKLRNFLNGCFSAESAKTYYERLTGDYGWYVDGYYYYVNRDDGSLYMQVRNNDYPFECIKPLPELTDVSEYSATKLIDGRLQVRIPNADPDSRDSIMTFVYENGEWKLDYYA